GKDDSITIPGTLSEIYDVFENEEKGSSKHLKQFLDSAKFNYEVAINDLVYKPGESISELINFTTLSKANQFFTSISSTVRKKIKSTKLQQILEFPVLFLGAKPTNTPSFYNFMNYADFGLGTWHPKGGMYEVVNGFVKLAEDLGVEILTNQNVEKIVVEEDKIKGVLSNDKFMESFAVISGADYHHTETLLPKKYRMYSEKYWGKKTFAPSALLFYVGFDTKIKNVAHHTLFFDTSFDVHAQDIYDNPKWPADPLFYASFSSITDTSFAPKSKEAATFLIPLAPGLTDIPEVREEYFLKIMERLENLTGQNLKEKVLFKESYCVNDFVNDYNSYKGNAYGLANTLFQTAFLRPKIKSKKVENLFFTGQLTVPGPGVPPAIISGKIVSDMVIKNTK
ncbi:phytoene desaturase family protein, partial [Lutibacter sp.]|uniref:phytoene desaturase family protein n=1 Tax=Lutibacter sp. TaxID=1925666 RepID=UPI0034A0A93B